MSDNVPRHPEVRTMVAFIEGRLAPGELAAVSAHLRGCRDCRTVVTETARFRQEERAGSARRPRLAWWLAAAAAIAAIVIAVPLLRRETTPIARLIAAAPREHRLVEARLSGFPWARLQAPSRGAAPADPADLRLGGAAGEVLDETARERSRESLRARGIAYLLVGRPADGIAALEEAAAATNDKQAWNDLAAARYSITEKHPGQLPLALAAADRALTIDPKFTEALFNRALILERMRIRDAARSAWRTYLDADPSSGWSAEAQAHLRALEGGRSRFDRKLFENEPAAKLAGAFPQETRTWGEGVLLAEWADAEIGRDSARAAQRLALTRRLGAALEAGSGEGLLAGAAAAVDASSGEKRAALAQAHRTYREARIAYQRRNASAAEEQFRRAERLFREGGSPMADVAAYYAASAAFDQNRNAEARRELQAILRRIDRSRARALTASIHWTLAVEANSSGDRGSAVRNSVAAAEIFRALGERMNASVVDGIAAHTFELIGDADLAWGRRVNALEVLCDGTDRDRCNSLLHDAAATLSATDHEAAAAALIDVTTGSGRSEDAVLLASALMKRARVATAAGDAAAARLALDDARLAAARIADDSVRAMLETQIAVEEASVARDPHAAIASLDRALDFLAGHDARHLLPHVQLQRARAFRSAGELSQARNAYAAVLREIDTQRQTIGDANARLSFLDTATAAIEESIELDLARGDVAAAFATADHRQALLDSRLHPVTPASRPLPEDTGVIEYAVLPGKMVLFCIANGRIDAVSVPVKRDALAARIAVFVEKLRRRETVQTESAGVFALLIAPLRPHLHGLRELVIVPDRQLYAVPFAALYDPEAKRYLIEDFVLRFALAASSASEPAAVLAPALVVADPPTPQWPALERSREEAARVAMLYGAALLAGEAATRARFIEEARHSALIHFAGHADSDAVQSYGALLLAADGDDSGVLETTDIERLELPARPLVVLAACGTFRGDPTHVSPHSSLFRRATTSPARAGRPWDWRR